MDKILSLTRSEEHTNRVLIILLSPTKRELNFEENKLLFISFDHYQYFVEIEKLVVQKIHLKF